MVVIVIDNASLKLRGELTKWLMEVKPGVFAGKISAMVRQRLWNKVEESDRLTGAVMLYSMNNEQGFEMQMCGDPTRKVVEINGLQLIAMEHKEQEVMLGISEIKEMNAEPY